MYPINLDNVPDGFEHIDDKILFDPKKHLQLEKPTPTHVKKLLDEKILDKNFQELKMDSIKELENASEILKSAIDQIKKGKSDIEHFGD